MRTPQSVLVDTSIWIDHIDHDDQELKALLERGEVLMHPFVVGEVALGNLANRTRVLKYLQELPESVVASDAEVLHLVAANGLHGRGVGYVDAHLLASTLLTPDAKLWTRDLRLRKLAEELGAGYIP